MHVNHPHGSQRAASSRLPLANFPIADTDSADEAEHILSRELNDLRIQSTGNRRGFGLHMTGAQLGQIMIGYNRFKVHTRVDPGSLGDVFIFSFGHANPSALTIDGDSLVMSPQHAVMCYPSCRLRIERAEGSGMFLIRTTPEALEDRLKTLTGAELRKPLRFDHRVDLSAEPGATVKRLVGFIISELESTGPYRGIADHLRALQELLLGALLTLPNNHSDLLADDYRGQIPPRLVRVAEDFIEAQYSTTVTISDLLAICGCSKSVLFEAFRRYRNYTPMQFLTKRRLLKARALLASDPDRTVTSIAQECGFSHLGRFSAIYRERFGVTPSESRDSGSATERTTSS